MQNKETPTDLPRKKLTYWLAELDISSIFNGKTIQEVIKGLQVCVDRQADTLLARSCDNLIFDVREYYDDDGDKTISGIALIGSREENDEEYNQRVKYHQEQIAHKEANDLLEYKRLHTKFGDIFNAK